ncbi:MAG: M24 family metallopeptidase [Armatimonadota bacterium]
MSDTQALFTERVNRAAAALRESGVDALLLTPGADLLHLTGLSHGHAGERLLAYVVRPDGSGAWISPAMNAEQVRGRLLPGNSLRAWTDAETYLPALRETLQGARSVAFDDETRAGFLLDLLSALPEVQVRRASDVTRGLRIRKDESELGLMRAAAEMVDTTIPKALSFCRIGRTESEIAADLRTALVPSAAAGEEVGVAFTIVAGGPNSALPHHDTGSRALQRGDVVILDFGTRFHGYHSDITVTGSVGEPADPEVRKVYRVVWEAQQKALEAVRPGVTCEALDRAAREQITAAGYGEYFLHRTGHGLGLQVHEPPYLVSGNTERLEEGMTFSVEPGIYLAGRIGVRLEVIAAVTADGVSLINAPSAPELPVVEQ